MLSEPYCIIVRSSSGQKKIEFLLSVCVILLSLCSLALTVTLTRKPPNTDKNCYKHYLEKLVNETLEALREIEAEETEP